MSVVHDYVNAIVRRRREPMEPIGFEPNWADKPRRHKVYRGATRFPLPAGERRPSATLADGLATPGGGAGGRAFTTDVLAGLLGDSYGLLSRRLAVQANNDDATLPQYRGAVWARGTASGGGLYPAEIYWVTGGDGPLLPGVYYYSTPHHAMQRLLAGDVTDQVRAALGDHPAAAATDQFLLVSVRFWKNAFKYNSFCYHVVTMDVGALLGTWQLWSRAHGLTVRPALTFDEPALNRLLGVDTDDESVFAVVPLPWPGSRGTRPPAAAQPPRHRARVARRHTERSRTVIRFPTIEAVHHEIVGAGPARPPAAALAQGAAEIPAHDQAGTVTLPAPTALDTGVSAALHARRSSFGRFSGHRPLRLPDLHAILAAGTAGGRLVSDVKHPDGRPALTRLVVFANHVDGLARGVYDHDPDGDRLGVVAHDDVGLFLQRNYFLPNYNLEQAAAVVVVLARPGAVVDAVGPRGYRFVNAEVGAVAQAVYTACAALEVGCGAALGFDNVSYSERLGIDGTGEWPLLVLMIGNERANQANLDHRIS